MRKLFVAAFAAFLPILVSAAPADLATLKAYATHSLQKCPDNKITIERLDRQGPIGFELFKVTQTSSDSTCGKQTILLYSPTSQQVLIGSIFELPADNRLVDIRVQERAQEILQQPVIANVAKFPLPDRIHAVSIIRTTPYGPFAYHGFVDASERFLMIATRGNLNVPPSKTLLEALGLKTAARRGNPKAKSQIIELSDFQCPTCGRAHKDIEPLVEKHLNKVDYYRIDLPLFEHHEWALAAALGARAMQKAAPQHYWDYVNYVYANQEEIGKRKFDDVLREWVQDHDISWPAVEKVYKSPAERAALLDQVSRIFDLGVISTPTYIVNGQQMGYGPKGSFAMKAVKDALGVK